MAVEEQFYKRHYGGSVPLGTERLEHFETTMLARGQRYALVSEYLSKQPSVHGCLTELGCGGGEALIHFSRLYRFDRAIGLDIATAASTEVHDGIEFVQANLNETWPLANGEVDYLIAMMVIEHLFDPFKAFGEIRRTLATTGVAFVNLPLVTNIKNRVRLVCGLIPQTSVRYEHWFKTEEWDGNHLHYFSMRSIYDLAKKSGLQVEDVRGVGAFYKIKSALPSVLAGEVTLRLRHR